MALQWSAIQRGACILARAASENSPATTGRAGAAAAISRALPVCEPNRSSARLGEHHRCVSERLAARVMRLTARCPVAAWNFSSSVPFGIILSRNAGRRRSMHSTAAGSGPAASQAADGSS